MERGGVLVYAGHHCEVAAFQIPHDGGGGHQVDEILLEAVTENSVILGEEDQHFCNYPHLKKPRRGAAAS